MRNKLLFLLLLIHFSAFSQDYSFSQFDLNLMYSNPAFAGYDNNNRVLIHRKNQWSGISEKFNSNLFALNFSKEIRKQGLGAGKVSWAGGIYLIEDHENTVLKKYELGIIPWTFHYQFPKDYFLSFGLQNIISFNSLVWDKLIFSDEIDEFGVNGNETTASIPYYAKYTNWFDPSIGIILTKHKQFNSNNNQIVSIGFTMHHLNRVTESFYNNQSKSSKKPIKYTVHGEYTGNIADFLSRNFRYWKVFTRHESQTMNRMQKDEIGFTTTLSDQIPLELGTIYRLGRYLTKNEDNKLMSESIIPILRVRLKAGRKIGMEIGYSYDFNISKLGNINSIATNEININFYFLKHKKSICPARGKWGKNKKWSN